MFIQLVGHTLHSDNGFNRSSDNNGTGCLSKVTCSKLKQFIQPVLILKVDHTLRTENGGTLSSNNSGTAHLSKVTCGKLKNSFNLC